ncbi:MAG: S41 family peptidase [Phycisphaerales bacterium]|nr:S41 family peptidase [Phycisphaerales bacterium]
MDLADSVLRRGAPRRRRGGCRIARAHECQMNHDDAHNASDAASDCHQTDTDHDPLRECLEEWLTRFKGEEGQEQKRSAEGHEWSSLKEWFERCLVGSLHNGDRHVERKEIVHRDQSHPRDAQERENHDQRRRYLCRRDDQRGSAAENRQCKFSPHEGLPRVFRYRRLEFLPEFSGLQPMQRQRAPTAHQYQNNPRHLPDEGNGDAPQPDEEGPNDPSSQMVKRFGNRVGGVSALGDSGKLLSSQLGPALRADRRPGGTEVVAAFWAGSAGGGNAGSGHRWGAMKCDPFRRRFTTLGFELWRADTTITDRRSSEDSPKEPCMTQKYWMAVLAVVSITALGGMSTVSRARSITAASSRAADDATLSDWSAQVWEAAKADDIARVNSLLESIPDGEGDALAALKNSVAQRDAHLVTGEATRLKELAKRQLDLATAVAAGEISTAMVHAVNIKFLMPPEEWTEWLTSDAGRELEAAAATTIKQAQAEGDLLLWRDVLSLQKSLHDGADTVEYKRLDTELDELTRRVTLVAEFAPRELFRLRKMQWTRLVAIAKAQGTDIPAAELEESQFNELFANDWKERLTGITPRLVREGLRQAASEHVTNAGWTPLLLGGLDSVNLLLDTPQIVENFPNLADPVKVHAMRQVVDARLKRLIQEPRRKAGSSDFQTTISDLLAVNEQTVGFPPELILREFGEGATAQLSKQYEDDYSEIIWPDNLRRFRQQIEGNFVGVGILIRHNDKRELIIVNPLEGSPASRAGIRPGDKITAVDGVSTVGWALTRAVDNITGPVGKPVKLTVARNDVPEQLEFPLKRASIKMRSVNGWWKKELDARGIPVWDWWVDPLSGIGYVRLTSFNENSFDDFMDAIRQMKRERSLNGLVLDLRGNPGGLLKSAVGFVNLFVESGTVVSVQDREENITTSYSAEPNRASLKGLPLVVLVNNGSASASEIVSGSLQVHGGAVILGERSFGKGSVQTVQPIQDGSIEAAVKVTTQYYVLPPIEGAAKGRLVHRRATSEDWGVNPDLVVKVTPPQAEASGETRLALDHLDEADRNRVGVDLRPDVQTLLRDGIDPQLETAVMILQARLAGDLEKRDLAQMQKLDPSKPAPQ